MTNAQSQPIVERLRQIHASILGNKGIEQSAWLEAADEIAGLREANHHYRDNAALDEKQIASLSAKVDELEARLKPLEAAALAFIAKVDRGEARSRESYDAFKAALAIHSQHGGGEVER
jgi:hypothetical protein